MTPGPHRDGPASWAAWTWLGPKDPARSRGVPIATSPTSVASVFGVEPLREFTRPRPAGSPFS